MWAIFEIILYVTFYMQGNIVFHGCECMVEIKHLIWGLISGLNDVGRSPTESQSSMT